MFKGVSISPRMVLVVLGLTVGILSAMAVTLPDTSQTTTLTANVSEQCTVTVPAGVSFTVTDTSISTDSAVQSVSIGRIVLATATKVLKLSIEANAANFTPPVALATTWAASDISWNDGTWTNATGATGTLSAAAYNEVATADADATTASVDDLVFTLASKNTIKRSGNHTLVCTWKVESIEP